MTTVKILPASLEQASVEVKNSCFVTPLIEVLERNNVVYSFTEGGIDFISQDDVAVQATNAYPNGIANKLFDKKELQILLSPFGFGTLTTEVIVDVDAITLTNFIVKLQNGSGGNLDNSKYKNFFAGVVFADKEAFKRHPLFQDFYTPGKYVAQNSIGDATHTVVQFFTAVNSDGDCYFWRNSTDTWSKGVRQDAALAVDGYQEYKASIQAFVKASGIKNTMFNLQCIKDGEVLYPIDWNFRWGRNCHKQILAREPQEYEKAVLHMVGIVTAQPNTATDIWLHTKEELAAL